MKTFALRVAGWAMAGGSVGGVAGALTARVNDSLEVPRDALTFSVELAVAYASVFALAAPLAALAGAVLRRAWTIRKRPPVSAATLCTASCLVALLCFAVFSAIELIEASLGSVGHSKSFAPWGAAVTLAIATWALECTQAMQRLGRLVALPILCGLVALSAPIYAHFLAPGRPSSSQPLPARFPTPARRVILVGVDGLEWSLLRRLSEEDRLPQLSRLASRGATARLATTRPTWSPIVWTTIATGMLERQHGVRDFTEIDLPGIELGVQRLRRAPIVARGFGIPKLFRRAVAWGLIDEVPVRATQRRTKALWNILSDQGRHVAIVNWFATWPAEAVRGVLVSDNNPSRRAFLRRRARQPTARETSALTYPPELMQELASLDDPESQALERDRAMRALPFFRDLDDRERAELDLETFRTIYRSDRFAATSALHLLRTRQPDFLAVYLSGVDNLSHRYWKFPSIIDRYYEHVDEIIGEFSDALDSSTTLVVLSDHGWSYERRGEFGHEHAPDGVLIMSGEEIRPGPLGRASVIDVAPTVLGLFGLPSSSEMRGRALRRAFASSLRRSQPRPARIASYGAHRPVWPSSVADAGLRDGEHETLRKLKALGYID